MCLSAEMSLDVQQKGNKCYANTIYTHVPHVDSLHKERWFHYMYRVTEINDIMYNIYRFLDLKLYSYNIKA